jgi:hypothetical protein
MPEKDWIVWLDRACRVEVERHSRGGRVTGFRIVLLADIDGIMHCVTRYDTSHGFAHRDILAFGGRLVAKELVEEQDFALAFEQAYLDIVNNYGRYLGNYCGTRG